jgi:hypothetical protein
MSSWSNVSNTRVVVSRKVVVGSFLLRLGVLGVAVALWAIASVANAQTPAATAIAALAAGIAIAVLSWRRAWVLLSHEGEPDVDSSTIKARIARPVRSPSIAYIAR